MLHREGSHPQRQSPMFFETHNIEGLKTACKYLVLI